jgi:hypothetical protein
MQTITACQNARGTNQEDRVVSSALPVPIAFELPQNWRPAEPEQVGAPEAAYIALRPEPVTVTDFVANITVAGERLNGDRSLVEYVDESLRRLRQTAPDAELVKRTETDAEQTPSVTQIVSLTTDVQGTPRRVLQVQVFLAVPDPQYPEQRAVIELVLSAVPEEIDQVVGDFRALVDSVTPHAGQAG